MKLSCQAPLTGASKVDEQFSMLAELGFDGVELWGAPLMASDDNPDEVARALEKTGLPVSVLCAGYRGALLDGDPAVRERCRGDIRKLLALAGRFGAVGLIVVPIFGAPRIPDLAPIATPEQLEQELLVAQLGELAGVAVAAGTKLILEPLNRGETHFMRTIEHASRIIDAVKPADGLALMGDLYHMNIEERDPCGALEQYADRLAHVHLADNTRLEPGTGITDFAGAFATLKKIGYEGYASLECGLSEPDRKECLAKTLKFLRSL